MPKRIDYNIISNFIENGSKVLDLGSGDGDLLLKLEKENQVKGEGIEISDEGITSSVAKGLAVFHGDIDEGLDGYQDHSFDYVILSQTLQMTQHPVFVINEMLRVGKKAIISIPNFGHYQMRLQLLLGKMPVTNTFPYSWADTPNIRHTTLNDFKAFCKENGFKIEKNVYLRDFDKKQSKHFSNLLARIGIFILTKEKN